MGRVCTHARVRACVHTCVCTHTPDQHSAVTCWLSWEVTLPGGCRGNEPLKRSPNARLGCWGFVPNTAGSSDFRVQERDLGKPLPGRRPLQGAGLQAGLRALDCQAQCVGLLAHLTSAGFEELVSISWLPVSRGHLGGDSEPLHAETRKAKPPEKHSVLARPAGLVRASALNCVLEAVGVCVCGGVVFVRLRCGDASLSAVTELLYSGPCCVVASSETRPDPPTPGAPLTLFYLKIYKDSISVIDICSIRMNTS